MVMVYLPFIGGAMFAGASRNPEDPAAMLAGGMIALVGLVIWCWITFRSLSRTGQSIAKKMVGIKVVRTDGSPASLGRIMSGCATS